MSNELVKYGVSTLVSLSDCDLSPAQPVTENALESIDNAAVSCAPFLDCGKIVRSGFTDANIVSCARDA